MDDSEKNKILENIYFNPAHESSFSTVAKIYRSAKKKISKTYITKWLQQQETYTRHKPRRVHFDRNQYEVNNIDDLWESDLIILNSDTMRRKNKNHGYIMGKGWL